MESFPQKKAAVIFILARMEITAVLYFLKKSVKLHFFSLGTIFEENMLVSRGMQSLGSGFPIGARASLLAHDFCTIWLSANSESLVCYTFCAATQWHAVAGKGLSHARQTLFIVSSERRNRNFFCSV